jgi:hypothetical protein
MMRHICKEMFQLVTTLYSYGISEHSLTFQALRFAEKPLFLRNIVDKYLTELRPWRMPDRRFCCADEEGGNPNRRAERRCVKKTGIPDGKGMGPRGSFRVRKLVGRRDRPLALELIEPVPV